MKWAHVGIILLGVLLLVTAAIKKKYHKKVKNIDGAVGVFKRDENVVGSEGDKRRKKMIK